MISNELASHESFWVKIRKNPFDWIHWLVYADWLDERGDARGNLIRLLWDLAADSPQVRESRRPDLWRLQQELLEDYRQWLFASILGVTEETLDGIYLEFCPELNLPVWPVQADYPSLEAAITAGKYGYVNSHITAENFEIEDSAIVVDDYFFVLGFPDSIKSEQAVEKFRLLRLREAKLQDAVCFGLVYPDAQRQWPIVALGSSCVDSDGIRRVPYLSDWHAGRRLYLSWWVVGWNRDYRFLATRK